MSAAELSPRSLSACMSGSPLNEERKGLLRAAPPTDRRMNRGSFLCVLTVLGVFLLLVLTTNVSAVFDVLHVSSMRFATMAIVEKCPTTASKYIDVDSGNNRHGARLHTVARGLQVVLDEVLVV